MDSRTEAVVPALVVGVWVAHSTPICLNRLPFPRLSALNLFPDASTCPHGGDAQQQTGERIQQERGVISLPQHLQAVVTEGGERGEPSTQSGGEQQPHFGCQVEACRQGVKQPDEETPDDVHRQRGPRKRVGLYAFVQSQLGTVAQDAAYASSQENG